MTASNTGAALCAVSLAALVICDVSAATPARKTRGAVERPYGHEGDPRKVKRAVTIDMSDTMRFFPDQIRVKRGDTVRFVLRNSGQSPHEMVIGTMDELKKKAALAKRSADAGGSETHAVHVDPGATGRLVWHFTRPGEFYYACLVPGHFDAGMIGTIVVR